jgi:hypothetical protein
MSEAEDTPADGGKPATTPGDERDAAAPADGDAAEDADGLATRVVLSIPADLVGHARRRVHQDYYKTFLRRAQEAAHPGDEWDEFTDVGCCGSQQDVPFRVESVEGGHRIGPETVIEYVDRDAEGLACDWSVQNELTE